MMPYYFVTQFHLGWFSLQAWGTLVALGFAISLGLAHFLTRKRGLDLNIFWDLSAWIMISALIFARLFYVLFGGEWPTFAAHPALIPALWQGGMSSIGGFFGVGLAMYIFNKIKKIALTPYLENLAWSFPFGWGVGRLGCFLIHDHPGRLTKSFLAVNFPGGARFDLGFLETVLSLCLAVIFLILYKTKKDFAFYPPLLLVCYGFTRFWLDFLRAWDLIGSDPRYGSLTLGQWGAIILFSIGICWFWAKKRSARKRMEVTKG